MLCEAEQLPSIDEQTSTPLSWLFQKYMSDMHRFEIRRACTDLKSENRKFRGIKMKSVKFIVIVGVDVGHKGGEMGGGWEVRGRDGNGVGRRDKNA